MSPWIDLADGLSLLELLLEARQTLWARVLLLALLAGLLWLFLR